MKRFISALIITSVAVFLIRPVWADSTKMYWIDSGSAKIQRANLDGSSIEDIVTTGLQAPRHIAFDTSAGKMYWTDAGTHKIQRANPDGSNIEDLVTIGISELELWGIALDIAGGKMYWTCRYYKIQRSNLDGSNIEDLSTEFGDSGIALDTLSGKMYLSGPGIWRANLDCSSIENLIPADMVWLPSVAPDVVSGKMYWTNYSSGEILRANLDGSNIESLVATGGNPVGITLDLPGSKMYWTDHYTDKIQRANLDGSNVEVLVAGLSDPWDIAIAENIENVETDDLAVIPFGGLNSQGEEGGPFAPSSMSYTLTNVGTGSINWTASATQSWLDVSPSSGTLGPNEINTVQLSINPNAAGLDVGIYNDAMIITNLVNGVVKSRPFQLFIRPKFKLIPPAADNVDGFGWAVGISGNRCIVGAPLSNSGAAYIFEWNGTNWIEQAKLTDPGDMENPGSVLLGYSVSIDGNRCVVGDYRNNENGYSSGAAYIFEWDGTAWIRKAKLLASDGAAHDEFGISVSISGDRCIVGAWIDDGIGSAYIFDWNGTAWTEQAKLVASNGAGGDHFGHSVSIDGDRCIVAVSRVIGMDPGIGSAYVFQWNGTTWIEQDELVAYDVTNEDGFGSSVSIYGDRCIIGAQFDDGGLGSAYIFDWNGTAWIEQTKLTALDRTPWDYLGCSVDICQNRCVIGGYEDGRKGKAYIFEWNGTTWIQKAKLTAADGAVNDFFGWSVSISGVRCIVGAYGNNDNGAAYVYQSPRLADLDRNLVIDFDDFVIFASQWLQAPGAPSADFAPPEGDGFVDYEDLAVFCQVWLD